MHDLRPALHLAKKMGEGLGQGKILQRTVPAE